MRWEQVDQILEQALSLTPEQRKPFLEQACAGDPSLRLEVEKLLALEPDALRTRNMHSLETDARASADEMRRAPDYAGRSLSHYRILEKAGEGGMGVVYRAHDEHLQRDVAIKVLPPGTLNDQMARKRFRKEALALSKLNHPNIGTVYDFDTEAGIDFLVMEYLQGETISQRLASGPFPGAEIVRLGEQMAEGLDSAHAQGIVHCDLKPGNLIIVSGGRLKILDFGLAKLLRVSSETPSSVSLSETRAAGGTIPYMSPEQLRGETVDVRSDLFSLGAVLYEMATGRRAFNGNTAAMVSDAILRLTPVEPARVNPEITPALQGTIMKALEKNPQDRYQSARELLADLRLQSSVATVSGPTPERLKRFRMARHAAAVLLAITVILASAWFLFNPRDRLLPEYRSFAVTDGANWESEPQISPDGKQIVYAMDSSGNRDVWLTDLNGTARRLTDDPADDLSPTWYPDQSAIAYVSERGGSRGIWRVSVKGGSPELLVQAAESPAISPDGTAIAYSKLMRGGYFRISVSSLSRPDEVRVLTGDGDGLWDHFGPAWSPDGKEICYWTRNGIWIIALAGGPARQLISGDGLAHDPTWSSSGHYIYFSSYRGGTPSIWRMAPRGGEAERVTTGTGEPESHPSLPRDGKRLVYATGTQNRQFLLVDRTSGEETVFSSAESDLFASLGAHGNRIVYASAKGVAGGFNLWLQAFDRGRLVGSPAMLTDFADTTTDPALSPDGRWIAYCRISKEQRAIWTMSISSREHFLFSSGTAADVHPQWSPDGSRLAFASNRAGGWSIWVAPMLQGKASGPAEALTSEPVRAWLPAWSPDGNRIVFTGDADNRSEVWVVAAKRGARARRLTDGAEVRRARWDPLSGDIIASAAWGTDRVILWRVNPQTGHGQPFTPPIRFGRKSDRVGLFDLSRDGRFVAIARSQGAKGQVFVLEAQKGSF